MTAKEMFKALGYKQTKNNNVFIEYKDDSHGDGDYTYIRFIHMRKEYEIGYYMAMMVTIKEHEAITKQMKELGWFKND